MKERPILFSGEMIRALLAGTKTQTRRVVRKQFDPDATPAEVSATTPEGWQTSGHSGLWWDDGGACLDDAIRCPYGIPGDRLYVKETWWLDEEDNSIIYRADKDADIVDTNRHESGLAKYNWRPSIFMPRWASRITLEIVSVRVERLQDISEADAMAEGAPFELGKLEGLILGAKAKYRSGFCRIWDSISAKTAPWASNPWVWIIEFRRVPA